MTFQAVHIEYLTPSRTIETIELRNQQQVRTVYVYNYEGYSFRLFESEAALKRFLDKGTEKYLHFSSEEALDLYLESIASTNDQIPGILD